MDSPSFIKKYENKNLEGMVLTFPHLKSFIATMEKTCLHLENFLPKANKSSPLQKLKTELGSAQNEVSQLLAKSLYTLAERYETENKIQDPERKAFLLYKKAADLESAEALCTVAVCYELGRGVKKDDAVAVEWYKKAALKGDADAMCALGEHYEKGLGVKKDLIAKKYFQQAAVLGQRRLKLNCQP